MLESLPGPTTNQEAGAHIHLFPRMMHAKPIVIDDVLALCGSVNLDGRSLFLDFEMTIAFYGRKQIDWLLAWIQEHVRVSPTYRPRKPSWTREKRKVAITIPAN